MPINRQTATAEQLEARKKYEREWRRARVAGDPKAASEAYRKYYDSNAEAMRAKSRAYYWKNRDRVLAGMWAKNLKALYGLTEEQYAALGGKCHICGLEKNAHGYRLHVDHCHDTGKVRGLLCHGCNTGIGGLRHDVATMRKAIEYLERHQQE